MFAIPFDASASLDPGLVGGKGHGLAAMTQAGIPVSPGFTVSTRAYRQFIAAAGLRDRIAALFAGIDPASVAALEGAEKTIAGWFGETELPAGIAGEVAEAYVRLGASLGIPDLSVAIRSSATAEDSDGTSFAGEYDTFVGIAGTANVAAYLRRCWASAFTARSMTYAWKNGISPLDVEMAVVVQKTVNARAAGVMFTLSPLTGDRSRIVIEASYGLGLSVVGGEVTPDRYVVAKIGGAIVERVVGEKHIEYLNGTEPVPVADERRSLLCLGDEEVLALARLGKMLERQHGRPVDVEFAIDRDSPADRAVVLLQCRPETYWSARHAAASTAPVGDPARAVLASVMRK